MGAITSFLQKRIEKRGIDDPNHWIVRLSNNLSTKSGLNITPETALNTSAVFACVRVISETVASLPLMIYRRMANGGKEVDDQHPLYAILHDSPNPWQTKFEFIEMETGHVCLRGNGYNFIVRDGAGRIKGFVPLNPARMVIEVAGDFDQPQITYRYRAEQLEPEQVFSFDEIWHIKGLSSDGITGISPLAMARESIGLAQASEAHGAVFFRNGAQPSIIASTPGKLHEDSHKRIKDSIQSSISGDNKFKVLLLEQGLDAKSIGVSNADSQFLETRQFQVEEIARIFRIPPILIGHSNNSSTYASAEQFMLSFVTHTIRPWVTRIEQSINKYLLSDQDKISGIFAEFKIDGLLRGDTASRYAAYASALQNTWMTRNEVRSLENLNPVDDGDDFENPAITTKNQDETIPGAVPAEQKSTVTNVYLGDTSIEPPRVEVHQAPITVNNPEINIPAPNIAIEVKGNKVTSRHIARDGEGNITTIEENGLDALGVPTKVTKRVLRDKNGLFVGLEER